MNKPIKVGSDFSGVGAFNQALRRINIDYKELFACDMDKYARKTFIHNYGEPPYYPENVYDRHIPTEPLGIYMTSPPCQAFSLAGKRKGEEDKRGVLFYNSHEFIQQNKPRYFIFENVKGLLSDDNGRTFQRWIDYLGGKSVNGTQTMFPEENAVPYHVYYQVLNAKDYGVPQNRERIFIIGIRDDADNNFNFPKPFELKKRLKDVLEENVDEKYYLSEKMISGLVNHQKFNKFNPTYGEDSASCITARVHKIGNADNYIKVGYINQDTQASQVIHEDSVSQTLCAGTHGYANGYVQTKVVGNLPGKHEQNSRIYAIDGISPTLTTMQGGGQDPKIAIGAIRGRNPDNPTSRQSGLPTQQMLEVNENGTSNCLTTVQKDNVVIEQRARGYNKGNTFDLSPSITCNSWQENNVLHQDHRIRKLTPRECFRLMDFPDTFDFSVVSDSQAYKQAGNSIVVNVLAQIISKFNLYA